MKNNYICNLNKNYCAFLGILIVIKVEESVSINTDYDKII